MHWGGAFARKRIPIKLVIKKLRREIRIEFLTTRGTGL